MDTYPERKRNRLKDYDYSSEGYYFITICTKDREAVLWERAPVGAAFGRLVLSEIGSIVDKEIHEIEGIYSNVMIDKYVVMPNHIHMIIILKTKQEEGGRPKAAPTIPQILNKFKGSISKQIGRSTWQKSYYDHVIRDEADYLAVWQYVDNNPAKWLDDEYYEK